MPQIRRAWSIVVLALCLAGASCAARTPRAPESIGVATMELDGTIVLQLRAEDPETGARGDGRMTYPRGHKEYDAILKHLGGLRPGETKPVPPWPDKQ